MEAIIVAIITGGLSLIGVVFSNMSANKKNRKYITNTTSRYRHKNRRTYTWSTST